MAETAPSAIVHPAGVEEPPHSLLGSARDLLGALAGRERGVDPSRWEGGFEFLPDGCPDGGLYAPCSDDTFVADTGATLVQWEPVVAYASDGCESTWAPDPVAYDREGRARRRLAVARHRLIEAEVWAGAVAAVEGLPNPVLSASTGLQLINAGDPTPLTYALGELQEALGAAIGGPGVIHAPRRLVTEWLRHTVVFHEEIEGGRYRIRDSYGNEVIAGVGYSGTGPDDETPALDSYVWAYGTPPVFAAEGPVEVLGMEPGAVDRDVNDRTVWATQTVAVAWDDCARFGVQVDICETCCVGEAPAS